jgi:magnesium-transporting ATPase (P-type)
MSVVVRIDGGPPVLLCKGADSSMFPVCMNGPYTSQVHIKVLLVSLRSE